MSQHYQKYINYIEDAGGKVPSHLFENYWRPIGIRIIEELKDEGLITEDARLIIRLKHEKPKTNN